MALRSASTMEVKKVLNNIDPNGKIDSTYLHSATDAPDNLKGRLVYSNTMSGTEYIANLDDGITFTGDVQKDVPKDYTQTPTKLNTLQRKKI